MVVFTREKILAVLAVSAISAPAVAQRPAAPSPAPPAQQWPQQVPVRASTPAASPDGRSVVFMAHADSAHPGELFILDLATGVARRLTTTPEFEGSATWSPDSRRLAVHTIDGGRFRGWIVDAATGARTPYLDSARIQTPAFSPDGRWIAFGTGIFPRIQLAVADAAGGRQRQVADLPGINFWPRWSPDGRQIVFTSINREAHTLTLYIVNADGTGLRAITDSTMRPETPAWSPDGRWIAFQMNRAGNTDIYLTRPDGGGLSRLTSDAHLDEVPTWLPDGRIVFQSDRRGAMELWIMQFDGSGQTILYPKEAAR